MTDGDVREALGGVAGDLDALDGEEASRRRSRWPRPARRSRPLGRGELEGARHPDRAGDVLGPGPAVPLLRAAVLLGEEVRAAADPQRPGPLRALGLVRGQRDEVGAERRRRRGRPTARPGPHRRGAGRRGAPARPSATSAIGWSVPDLVVGEHHGHQRRAVGDRRLDVVGRDPPVPVDRHLDDLEPEVLEVGERVADRVVLDRRRHDPVAARLARPRGALEREVVGLGPAAREHDLAGVARRSRAASRSWASSSASRATRPNACGDDGLPNTPPSSGIIASSTSGRRGVVAAWSR